MKFKQFILESTCKKCEGGILDITTNDKSEPIYKCRNCNAELPRKIYNTKKKQDRDKNQDKLDKLFKSLTESMKFTNKETGMSKYDDVLSKPNYKTTVGWNDKGPIEGNYWRDYKHWDWKVIQMSPEAYIKACTKGFGVEATFARDDLSKMKELADKGHVFDMPVLDYGEYFNQEGLHRAMYAKQLGLKTIPVLVFVSDNRKKKIDDIISKIS